MRAAGIGPVVVIVAGQTVFDLQMRDIVATGYGHRQFFNRFEGEGEKRAAGVGVALHVGFDLKPLCLVFVLKPGHVVLVVRIVLGEIIVVKIVVVLAFQLGNQVIQGRAGIVNTGGDGQRHAEQLALITELGGSPPAFLVGPGVYVLFHVPVELIDVEQTPEQVGGQRELRAEGASIVAVQEPQHGLEAVGMGEDGRAVAFQPALGQRTVAGQTVIDPGQRQVGVLDIVQIAELAEHVADMAVGEIAKAVFQKEIAGHEIVKLAVMATALQQGSQPSKTAAPDFGAGARMAEAPLGLHDQRSAQGVAAIDRV